MTTLREDIFSTLTSDSPPLTIYTNVRKQGSPLPAVVVTIIFIEDEEDLGGNDCRLANAHIQTDTYSTIAKESDLIAARVRGLMRSSTQFASRTTISAVDEYEDETGLYRVRSEFSIWRTS